MSFDPTVNKVIHFSGGHSSALMTISSYVPGDIVLFCDTGREHEGTYRFIADFEAFEGISVTQVSYPGGWSAMLKKHNALPNSHMRFCTGDLKILQARRYLRSVGVRRYTQLIGFRADEQRRAIKYKANWKTVKTVFPLIELGLSKIDVENLWAKKPYRLSMPRILGNCTLCFLKGKAAIIAILTEHPELADPWIEDEESNPNGHTYFEGVTMRQLLGMAGSVKKQYNLIDMEPAMQCACTQT